MQNLFSSILVASEPILTIGTPMAEAKKEAEEIYTRKVIDQ